MPAASLSYVLRHLRTLSEAQATRDLSDGELLERFRLRREEAALALLVQRHGPMVLGVCRRLLTDVHSAEDAFQATFLVLVRKAASIRRRDSVASWLHGVARRIAATARRQRAQARLLERRSMATPHAEAAPEWSWHELRTVLDEELAQLPEKYRTPLVLCGLEGKTHEQAARELGWPKSSLSSRLARARELLRGRLTRRGITLSAVALTSVLAERAAAAVPALLLLAAVRAATQQAGAGVTAGVAALTEEGIKALGATKMKAALALVLSTTFLATAVGVVLGRQASADALQIPPTDLPAAHRPDTKNRQPNADQLGKAPRALAPDRGKADAPLGPRDPEVADQGENAHDAAPEAAVHAFLACMNRADLRGATAFVADAWTENAADWIAAMLQKNGWRYTARRLHVEAKGDTALARVAYEIQGDPGAAARPKHEDGLRVESFRLRRIGGQWKIAPEEEARQNSPGYGPIQVYAMMLARDEKAAAQRRRTDQDLQAKLEEYLKAATEAGLFTGAALVGRDGRALLSAGFGLANIEHGVANTPKTRFDIGSVDKTFTAALVLLLRDAGKLRLDDPIGKYIPESPAAWQDVTVRHLLSHTSGIRNYTELPEYFEARALPSFLPNALQRIRRMPLQFEPGAKFDYSNTGYLLLEEIIRKASGTSFATCLQEKILSPLGMHNTGTLQRPGIRHCIIKDLASGYTDGIGPLEIAPWVWRSGLYATAEDLHLWGQAFFRHNLFPKKTTEEAITAGKGNYGYGWFVFDKPQHRFIMHGGNTPGFGLTFAVYPEDRVVIVVASNLDTAPTGRIHDDLAKIVFGEKYQLPPRWKEISVDPGLYDGYVGRYRSTTDPQFVITITKENDRLWGRLGDDPGAATMVLRPLSETKYFNKMFVLYEATFVRDESGRVNRLIAEGPWGRQEFMRSK